MSCQIQTLGFFLKFTKSLYCSIYFRCLVSLLGLFNFLILYLLMAFYLNRFITIGMLSLERLERELVWSCFLNIYSLLFYLISYIFSFLIILLFLFIIFGVIVNYFKLHQQKLSLDGTISIFVSTLFCIDMNLQFSKNCILP